jgi:hypothetical protein
MQENETPRTDILSVLSEMAAQTRMLDQMALACHAKVNAAEKKIYAETEKSEVEWLDAIEEYFKTEEAVDELRALSQKSHTRLQKAVALATATMNITEFKALLEQENAGFIVKNMPMYFTGKLLQASLTLSLADAALQFIHEWETRGICSRVDGLTGGRGIRLTVAGVPRAILQWIVSDVQIVPVEGEAPSVTLQICEDEMLIEECLKHQASADEY